MHVAKHNTFFCPVAFENAKLFLYADNIVNLACNAIFMVSAKSKFELSK